MFFNFGLEKNIFENLKKILKHKRGRLDELFIHLYCYYIFHFLISAATGAAAPGCSGTVNTAD